MRMAWRVSSRFYWTHRVDTIVPVQVEKGPVLSLVAADALQLLILLLDLAWAHLISLSLSFFLFLFFFPSSLSCLDSAWIRTGIKVRDGKRKQLQRLKWKVVKVPVTWISFWSCCDVKFIFRAPLSLSLSLSLSQLSLTDTTRHNSLFNNSSFSIRL